MQKTVVKFLATAALSVLVSLVANTTVQAADAATAGLVKANHATATAASNSAAANTGNAIVPFTLPSKMTRRPSVVDSPAAVDWSQVENGNCLVVRAGWGFRACAKGDPNGYWNVGLIGDSHMRQYFAPLDVLAKRYHWKITYISKSACTVADWQLFPKNRAEPSCWDWNKHLGEYFASHEKFDLVINSNSAFVSVADPKMADAYRATVQSQIERGTQWMVISDNPKPAQNFVSCIAAHGKKAQQDCALPYSKAMVPVDVLPAAVQSIPGVHVADFRKDFCPNLCPPIINGVVVYRDFSHLSSNFVKTMLPQIDAAIPAQFKAKPVETSWFPPTMSVGELVAGLSS